MPIMEAFCSGCKEKFEQIFLTFKDVKNVLTCPRCGKKSVKEEFSVPARFAGTFGENGSAPSRRHSYKKSDKKGNAGSAA